MVIVIKALPRYDGGYVFYLMCSLHNKEERYLISRVRAKLRGRLPMGTVSADERRQLQARLRILHTELRDLKAALEDANSDLPHADYSEELLSYAEDALADGDVESFWRSVSAAKQWELRALARLKENDQNQRETGREHGLDPLQVRAQRNLLEATDMFGGQSSAEIEELLGGGDGSIETKRDIDILAATQLLYNGLIKEYREKIRYRTLKRQLVYFVIIGLASVLSIVLLWDRDYSSNAYEITDPAFLEQVHCFIGQVLGEGAGFCFISIIFIFGVLGAATSSTLSLSRGILGTRVPEQVGTIGLTIARATVGGTSALVIYIFLIADIIELVTLTPGVTFAFAFIGGFTERLLVQAVESIAGASQGEDSVHTLEDELDRSQ